MKFLEIRPKISSLGEQALTLDIPLDEIQKDAQKQPLQASLSTSIQTPILVQQKIWNLAQLCRQHQDISLIDIVIGMNNLTLFLTAEADIQNCEILLGKLWDQAKTVELSQREVKIPVQYGGEYGPDLEEVANFHGLSCDEVIKLHSEGEYLVYFLGFQPGFAYLGGLSKTLHTPRRSKPRLAVPAGSVGIGGQQTGVYPASAPGGWQLIGRTDLKLFDANKASPTLLQPGDKVRFVAVGHWGQKQDGDNRL